MKEILGDVEGLLLAADKLVESVGVKRDDLIQADLICYRVETNQRYEEMKLALASKALLLDESEVSGRMIAIFELTEPLQAGDWRVSYIELPQPKENNKYREGLEHVQFVTRSDIGRFADKYTAVDFEVGGSQVNKLLEISNNVTTVKFHDKDIGTVLELEAEQ